MRFTKMHGIGNDYVYVDCFAESCPDDPAGLARQLSDRHMGVGGDGLILICPSKVADARMRMFNADGTESEMCGNGIRCLAKYVFDHGIAKQRRLSIETGAGVLALDLEVVDGKTERVRVDMGQPALDAARIPVNLNGTTRAKVVDVPLEPFIELADSDGWIERCGFDRRMTCVAMGNPHVVLYCKHVAEVPLAQVGPVLETHPVFPRRVNVHFVEVHGRGEVTMRTWERGSGITLACGTGASAVCVAGSLSGRTDRKILAHLAGGDLELDWAQDDHVYMTGPATEVFTGEWPR
jgi:diaminopimelate epimerase